MPGASCRKRPAPDPPSSSVSPRSRPGSTVYRISLCNQETTFAGTMKNEVSADQMSAGAADHGVTVIKIPVNEKDEGCSTASTTTIVSTCQDSGFRVYVRDPFMSGRVTPVTDRDSGLSSQGTTPPPKKRESSRSPSEDSDSEDSFPGRGIIPDELLKEVKQLAIKLRPVNVPEEVEGNETSASSAGSSPSPCNGTQTDSFLSSGDCYYDFHLCENLCENEAEGSSNFAGARNVFQKEEPEEPIKSTRGTVRGVKNRVRAGIAAFQESDIKRKSWMEKEAGKVVVYTTNLGVIRRTYQECMKVKNILRTLLVKFEERDIYLNPEVQTELRERLEIPDSNSISVPHVYVEGQWLADADLLERLNESGELRRILRPYKRVGEERVCTRCGGYRMLPCTVCNGSKKSVHRSHRSMEFRTLRCMHCDASGLIRCPDCNT